MSLISKDKNHMHINKYINSLKIPFEELKSATNNFARENLLKKSSTSSSKVYKGQLLQSGQMINIVVRTCVINRETHFFNEMVMSKNLRHNNIVSIFKVAIDDDFDDYDTDSDDDDDDDGSSDEGDGGGGNNEDDDDGDAGDGDGIDSDGDSGDSSDGSGDGGDGSDGDGDGGDSSDGSGDGGDGSDSSDGYDYGFYIVTKQEVNGSLDKHLSGSTLTWMQRLKICVGVAQALTYIHYDAEKNHSIMHGNIRSSKILLDQNWEPKLHGFGSAVRAKRDRIHVTSGYNGSLQYMDPLYETTRGLTHKSDVFSFGVLLFEVLFGREAASVPIPDDQDQDKWYFARLARRHYEEKTLDHMIDPDLRNQMNSQSLNIFSITAYSCLEEQRFERPNMIYVLKKLNKALGVQHRYELPKIVAVEGTSSHQWKGINLDHLKIKLSDIEAATKQFSDDCKIGSGGYAKVYQAQLEHFDGINSLAIEGHYKGDFPKRLSTVAVKRIFNKFDREGEEGFLAEIEMLSKCKHSNIVCLLGFCDEGPEMILVYEYASNGSLSDYMRNEDNMINLSWAQRIQIGIDIANGLSYLHTPTENKETIVHRDIKSANVLLTDKLVAKIADFGLSKLHNAVEQGSTLVTKHVAGTGFYLDPEYKSSLKLKTKSDVYSFGVVLFEIMCGKLAHHKAYGEKGLPSIARGCFRNGTIKELVDPQINELEENMITLNGGVNQDSLDTFSKTAYDCVAETQFQRPGMELVIKELEKALNFQKNSNYNLHMSLETIKMGTQKFSDDNCIGEGKYWKLYEGKVSDASNANGYTFILAKRWDNKSGTEGHDQFWNEFGVFSTYNNHDNIIGLLGYCNEFNEKIIVYEHASNGRLDKHLDDSSLTWMKRLKICINVASGLKFLHTYSVEDEDTIMHTKLKSSAVLLDSEWIAKISNLEFSRKSKQNQTYIYDSDDGYSIPVSRPDRYCYITQKSDIYALGVILLEVLCGRLAWGEGCKDHSQSLGPVAQRHYDEKGSLDEMVFQGIKEQIAPKSLATFQKVAISCLIDRQVDRPTTKSILTRLNKALELQDDHDIWELKLPSDSTEIITMVEKPEKYSSMKRKDLIELFVKGILLQDGKLWLSLSSKGEWNETISAKTFSYGDRGSYKWRSIQKSRFKTVAKLLDISNLNIQIKIKTQYLSTNVMYGAYLVFKFCDPKKYTSKPRYVNLKYRMGGESLQTYFATWKDKEWMMIELCRFQNHKKDTDFEVLIESMSRSYCGGGAIYVEGIEFRVIDNNNVKREKVETLKEEDDSELDWKMEMTELGKQQVCVLNYKHESEMMMPDTDYMYYYIFKLSEKCDGLHCPVLVRDVLNWKNKETRIVYFRKPSISNLLDNCSVPKEIEDGYMEVLIGKFNSTSDLRDGGIPIYLKLIAYEGTFSGLIQGAYEMRRLL